MKLFNDTPKIYLYRNANVCMYHNLPSKKSDEALKQYFDVISEQNEALVN